MEKSFKMKAFLYPFRAFHGRLHEWRENVFPYYLERFRNPKAVYLVLTPEHSNLGDHAIAEAEVEILYDYRIPYIELTGKQLIEWSNKKRLHVMNGRTIIINGGGNIGSLWPDVEALMEDLISANPKSTILILPNTAYFDMDETGKQILEQSSFVFNSHKQLKLYAREKISYDLMCSLYNDVSLVPDMVLRMNKCKSGTERKGCILCLRSDRERTRSEEVQEAIVTQAKELFGNNIRELDMVADHPIPVSERNRELEKQYDAFRHAELVITDRLHGMIFCAITGTPCIVINSKSPKVRGCYEWIKDLPYIRFCDDVTKLKKVYHEIPKQEWQYDNKKLLPLYEPLKHAILTAAKR